jgi:hypothetical protein
MSDRKVLVKAFAARYRAARKKERGAILDELVAVSEYNRVYASWLLRWHGKKVHVGHRLVLIGDATKRVRRRRARIYDEAVVAALKRVWVMLDYISGKRLAPALGPVIEALERHGELELEPEVRAKLLSISPATIDRALADEKKRYALKSRARTKPGTLLRHQVPMRTFADWDDAQPGFVEVDLVGHDGGWNHGEFAQTLTLTDIATGWTELATARNKAQLWVFPALEQVRQRLPFPLVGIDSDNGAEFINHHLVRYCNEQRIVFTRSRPYRKNDNCFVEQKNWSVVRRFVGYARYDTDQACALLGKLDAALSEYLNFFIPSMKLLEKVREGGRVHKRYDRAQTPLARALASPDIPSEIKLALRERAASLNPAALMRTIRTLQRKLDRVATAVPQASNPTWAADAQGLRKAGAPTQPPAIFPQPLEIEGSPDFTPPAPPTSRQETSHAFR